MLQDHGTTVLTLESDYPIDPLSNHTTTLSEAAWAGCAASLVCVDCKGLSTTCLTLSAKGVWEAKKIDNPEYVDDDEIYTLDE